MNLPENGVVESHIENGVGTITFGHPKSNSLPSAVLKDLAETITAFGDNKEVLVIVLKSFGDRAFCAGASFDELVAIENFEVGKTFFMGFARVINAMRKAPKFIITRVQGKTVGGGVGIASASDYTIATPQASVKLSELAVGIGPFVVGPAVERKIGTSAAYQLALNASAWQTAEWALEKGMFASLESDVTALDTAVNALAKQLSSFNPEAMSQIKTAFWSGTENWDELLEQRAEQSGRLVLSDFTRNAIAAFKAR